MAVRIKFDSQHNAIEPTLVLATRSGKKLGQLPAFNIVFKDQLNSFSEISFCVYKYLDDRLFELWDELRDFKLVWCREWDTWYEIYVETDEADELIKNVTAKSLGEAELSQTNLYNVEINTEADIERDDYEVTILYDKKRPSASLLDRLLEKTPHYTVRHVDDSIAKIQRTFTFNDKTVYDALQDVATEIHCLVEIDSGSKEDGSGINRSISLYDLESYCYDCNHRGEFSDACPKCGSKNVTHGYGLDTSVFVCGENLTSEIKYTTNTGSVKNCFRLKAGDDLMTATIRNCNPNGSGYLWYIPDEVKADMSKGLRDKINAYDEQYRYYEEEYGVTVPADHVAAYNSLVKNCKSKTSESLDYQEITNPLKGFSALIGVYYDTVDFGLYLNDSMMPASTLPDTTAAAQASKLTKAALSPVGVQNLKAISETVLKNSALSMAKAIVDARYDVKVKSSAFASGKWTGTFTVVNKANEDDTADSASIQVEATDDYETFVKQKLKLVMAKNASEYGGVTAMFDMSEADFKALLKKFGLSYLSNIRNACQSCIDILIQQGVANDQTWVDKTVNLYDTIYVPYYNKLGWIEDEIKQREADIAAVQKIQDDVTAEIGTIHDALDFENYLGKELWSEFLSYRREDTFSNDNFISDGLTDAELIENALTFIETAKKEIYRSAVFQHSITATLNNLLVMKEFEPIVDKFELGNWLRIRIDEKVYRLRLIAYEINFNDLSKLNVTFSDVQNVTDGFTDIESILSQAASMATSYSAVSRQANAAKKARTQLDAWVNDGLALTKMRIIDDADNQNIGWDEHGLLAREYLPMTDSYSDKQLKLLSRGLYMTDDAWRTAKAAIGDFTFWNPKTKQNEESYGVIADVLVGNMILSKEAGVYNSSGSLLMDDNGFVLTTDTSSDASAKTMFTIQKKTGTDKNGNDITQKLLYLDNNGNLVLNGSISVYTAGANAQLDTMYDGKIDGVKSDLDGKIDGVNTNLGGRIDGVNKDLTGKIDGVNKDLSGKIGDVSGRVDTMSTKVAKNAEELEGIDDRMHDISSDAVRDGLADIDSRIGNIAEDAAQTAVLRERDNMDATIRSIASEVANDANKGLSDKIEKQYADVQTQVSTLSGDVSALVPLGQYMQYGDTGLILGATSSNYRTRIDNTGMYFEYDKSVVSYIRNSLIHMPNAVIDATLRLGDHYFFSVRDGGGVSLTWQS